MRAVFRDRLYVELQRHPGEAGLPEAEAQTERGHVELAYALDLPLVATNDVYFPKSEMYEAHDALICIAEGAYVDQTGAAPPPDAAALFQDRRPRWRRCSPICPRRWRTPSKSPAAAPLPRHKRKPILPQFADDEVEELRRQAREGLDDRLARSSPMPPRPRTMTRGWNSSWASSSRWAFPAIS